MFKVDNYYYTVDKSLVKIINKREVPGSNYRTVKGDDGIWRYNSKDKIGAVVNDDPVLSNHKKLLLPAIKTFCPICGHISEKALYLIFPMFVCSNRDCNYVNGFWSWIIDNDYNRSDFYVYKRGYIKALFNQLKRN